MPNDLPKIALLIQTQSVMFVCVQNNFHTMDVFFVVVVVRFLSTLSQTSCFSPQ
jgi:hypothetical protein